MRLFNHCEIVCINTMVSQEILDDIALTSQDITVAHATNSVFALKKIVSGMTLNIMDLTFQKYLLNKQLKPTLQWLLENDVDLSPAISNVVLSQILMTSDNDVLKMIQNLPDSFFWCISGYEERLMFALIIVDQDWLYERLFAHTHQIIIRGWGRTWSMRSLMAIRLLVTLQDSKKQYLLSKFPNVGISVCEICYKHTDNHENKLKLVWCDACKLGKMILGNVGDSPINRYCQRHWCEHLSIWTERLQNKSLYRYFNLSKLAITHPPKCILQEVLPIHTFTFFISDETSEYVICNLRTNKSLEKFKNLHGPIEIFTIETNDLDTDGINIVIENKVYYFEHVQKTPIYVIKIAKTVGSAFYEWMKNDLDVSHRWLVWNYIERLDTFKLTNYPCAENLDDENMDIRKETWLPFNSLIYSVWKKFDNVGLPRFVPAKWGDDESNSKLHINPYNNTVSFKPGHVFR
jgi:hypothetical protein